jgi:hypothetical protein
VRAVDLAEQLPSVDEQHAIRAIAVAFTAVKEPQRDRQRHRVEEIRADRDDHVDEPILDQHATDLALAVTGVRRRVGHHEASSAGVVSAVANSWIHR